MADSRRRAKEDADRATTSLIEAQEKYLKDVPLNQILSAGLTNQHELIDKLASLVIASDIVPADERDEFDQAVQRNNDLIESIQLQTLYSSKEDTGIESYTDPDTLITPIYEEGDPPLVTSVSDTQVKNIIALNVEDQVGPTLDEHIENFLTTVFTVAKQLNLSHRCCSDVIQRKLTKTARTIFHSWMQSNNLTGAQVDLPVLCHFIEKTFCLYSSPRAVNLQLTNLPKIKNAQYLQAIGKITKLCRLSVRNVKDKEQRELIEQTKAIEAFRSICNEADKAFLIAEDRARAENHKLPLTIHKAGQLLAQRYADSVQNTLSASDTISSNRAPENCDQDSPDVEPNPANYVPRFNNQSVPNRPQGFRPPYGSRGLQRPFPRLPYPNYRPRGNYQGQSRQPNYQNANQNYQNTNQNYQNPYQNYQNPNQRQNVPRPPLRYPGGARNRGGQRPPFQNRGRGRPAQRNGNERFGPERRPWITAESLGMAPNVCLFCNDPSHRYYDKSCKYFGRSQLQKTNCRNCLAQGLRGGHSGRSCLEKRVVNVYKTDQEEDVSIDNFLDQFGSSKNEF